VILNQVEGGMPQVLEIGRQFNKFTLFDFTLDFTKTYTFWAGLIGGCFLTMSTHGTDQYLCSALSLHEQTEPRVFGFAFKRRSCFRAISSDFYLLASYCLPSTRLLMRLNIQTREF
jgi:hypothetical protein